MEMAGLSENIILINQTIRRHIGTVVMTPAIKLDINAYVCALNLCSSRQKKVSGYRALVAKIMNDTLLQKADQLLDRLINLFRKDNFAGGWF